MLTILNLEPDFHNEDLRAQLAEVAQVDYELCESQSRLSQLLSRKNYEVIFTRIGLALDESVFHSQPKLRVIVTPTTGLNHIDQTSARKHSVQILSLKGQEELLRSVGSTAEHTWALVLALSRHLKSVQRIPLLGEWKRPLCVQANELSGKVLGIIGYGRLGKRVAAYAEAFGMKVLIYDQFNTETELEHLLQKSDYLSLHLSLNESTQGFLSQIRINQIKPGACLINTARGELIDEGALLRALQTGQLRGAALDVLVGDSVWNEDSDLTKHPLLNYAQQHENLIITPHVGGWGKESIQMTRTFMVQQLLSTLSLSQQEI